MTPSTPPKKQWSWRSQAFRGLVYQALALGLIALALWYLAHNTLINMRARGIQSGFDFLLQTAGFDIGESLFAFDSSEKYWRAFLVGLTNTLRVALLGIIFTTLLGTLVGVGRFSRNALVRGLCSAYVEVFRNIPILLQLLMWYLLFTELLPDAAEANDAASLLAHLPARRCQGFFPAALADKTVAFDHPPHHANHQPQRHIRHRLGDFIRRACAHNAARLGRDRIQRAAWRSITGDDFELRQRLHGRAVATRQTGCHHRPHARRHVLQERRAIRREPQPVYHVAFFQRCQRGCEYR